MKIAFTTVLSKLNVGDQFTINETAHLTNHSFIYKLPKNESIFTVLKVNKTSISTDTEVIDSKYRNNNFVVFKFNSTGHFRSEGKDISVNVLEK